MGVIKSCIGKRGNKVDDIKSEEEADAYSKMVEDSMQTKPLYHG